MPNIKFNYLYRCGGNYKKFNSVIFSNPDDIELSDLETLIKSKLICETLFYAEDWQLPEVFTDIIDFWVDPTLYEFESIAYSEEAANSTSSLAEFIETLRKPN